MSTSRAHPVRSGPQTEVAATSTGTFQVTAVHADASCASIELQGDLDLGTADLLTGVLDAHLAAGRCFVRLDMSRLAFLDCAGLRVLVRGHNEFLAHHGTLVLTGITARTACLLRITHLDHALFIADRPHNPGHIRNLTPLPTSLPAPINPVDPAR